MQSIYVFLDIKKFDDFQGTNTDVRRTHGVCHETKRHNCAKFHHYGISVTDFRKGARNFLLSSREQSRKGPS